MLGLGCFRTVHGCFCGSNANPIRAPLAHSLFAAIGHPLHSTEECSTLIIASAHFQPCILFLLITPQTLNLLSKSKRKPVEVCLPLKRKRENKTCWKCDCLFQHAEQHKKTVRVQLSRSQWQVLSKGTEFMSKFDGPYRCHQISWQVSSVRLPRSTNMREGKMNLVCVSASLVATIQPSGVQCCWKTLTLEGNICLEQASEPVVTRCGCGLKQLRSCFVVARLARFIFKLVMVVTRVSFVNSTPHLGFFCCCCCGGGGGGGHVVVVVVILSSSSWSSSFSLDCGGSGPDSMVQGHLFCWACLHQWLNAATAAEEAVASYRIDLFCPNFLTEAHRSTQMSPSSCSWLVMTSLAAWLTYILWVSVSCVVAVAEFLAFVSYKLLFIVHSMNELARSRGKTASACPICKATCIASSNCKGLGWMPSTLFLPPGFLFGGICHDSKRDSGLHTQQPERSPELVREAAKIRITESPLAIKSRSHEVTKLMEAWWSLIFHSVGLQVSESAVQTSRRASGTRACFCAQASCLSLDEFKSDKKIVSRGAGRLLFCSDRRVATFSGSTAKMSEPCHLSTAFHTWGTCTAGFPEWWDSRAGSKVNLLWFQWAGYGIRNNFFDDLDDIVRSYGYTSGQGFFPVPCPTDEFLRLPIPRFLAFCGCAGHLWPELAGSIALRTVEALVHWEKEEKEQTFFVANFWSSWLYFYFCLLCPVKGFRNSEALHIKGIVLFTARWAPRDRYQFCDRCASVDFLLLWNIWKATETQK